MPGPPPKAPALRQRMNKASTKATLPAEGSAELVRREIPDLPHRSCPGPLNKGCPGEECAWCDGAGVLPWCDLARDFWTAVWRSPMSAEFVDADVPGLYILADLHDRFWRGDASLAAEIRLERQQYGLDALARRRLQWEVSKVKEAERRAPKTSQPAPKPSADPRRFLRSVK